MTPRSTLPDPLPQSAPGRPSVCLVLAVMLVVASLAAPPAPAAHWRSLGPGSSDVRTLVIGADGLLYGIHGGRAFVVGPGQPLDDLAGDEGSLVPGTFVADPRPGGSVYRRYSPGNVSPPLEYVWRLAEDRSGWIAIPCDFRRLLFPPDEPSTVACWRDAGGVPVGAVSHDGGVTWTTGSPIDPDLFRNAPVQLDLYPLRRSDDGGRTFVPVAAPPGSPSGAVVLGEEDFLVTTSRGVYRSGDGGASWSEVDVGTGDQPWNGAAARGDQFLVWGLTGVVASTDGGASWQRLDLPLVGPLGDILPDPSEPQRIVGGGLYTEDGGEVWLAETDPDFRGGRLERHPLDPLRIFAHPFWFGPASRSDDFGRTWRPVRSPPPGGHEATNCQDLRQDPSRPEGFFCLGVLGLYQSLDGGRTWRLVGRPDDAEPVVPGSSGLTRRIAVAGDGTTLYAYRATFSSLGPPGEILRSADGGEEWAAVTGIEVGEFGGLEVDRVDDAVLWLWGPSPRSSGPSAGGVLLRWDDGRGVAEKWPFPEEVLTFDQAADSPGRQAVGTADGGVWYRDGSGSPWSRAGGLELSGRIHSVRWDGDALFVAAAEGGWVSRDLLGSAGCVPSTERLCLGAGGRLEVGAAWRTVDGPLSIATTFPLTADTGAFWFFEETNLELVVKTVDGCAVNGHTWIYVTGLTDVGVSVQVRDVATGTVWEHGTEPGSPFAPRFDVFGLPCPAVGG